MITGDHPSTAKAIAIKLGIATEESNVLTGEQIDLLYESKQLGSLDPFPTVFARVSTFCLFLVFGNKIASSTDSIWYSNASTCLTPIINMSTRRVVKE